MHAVGELQWQQQAAAAECDGKKKAAHARFAKVWRTTRVEGRGGVVEGEDAWGRMLLCSRRGWAGWLSHAIVLKMTSNSN